MAKDPSGEFEIHPDFKELYEIDPLSPEEVERRRKLYESLPKMPKDLVELRKQIKHQIILQNEEGYPFDHYQVHGVITGGMGMVLEAWNVELKRKEALKLWMEEDANEKLVREAQTLARLRPHPNIVTVYGIGTWNDRRYFKMEWIDGQTAWDWFKQETRSWREVRDLYLAAGAGLASAHDDNIHHRDFKPSNILVGHDGRVCVVDFGVADTMRSSERLEMIGNVAGTTSYMAPERLRGMTGDARSDQFSFCVALWRCLHLQMPYWGETEMALLLSIEDHEIVPGDPHADVPHWLSRVVRKGLHPDPDQRYASMHELLAALKDEPKDGNFERDVEAVTFPNEAGGYMHAPVSGTDDTRGVVDVEPTISSVRPRASTFVLGALGGLAGVALGLGALMTLQPATPQKSGFRLGDIEVVQVISADHAQWRLGVRRFNEANDAVERGDLEATQELWMDGRERIKKLAPVLEGAASLGLAQRIANTKLDMSAYDAACVAVGAAESFQHAKYWSLAKQARTKAAGYFRDADLEGAAAEQDLCAAAHELGQGC